MNIKKIKKILKKEAKASKVKLTTKDFPLGYWLNPINNNWVTKRVYVSPKSKTEFCKLVRTINKLNEKLVKSNKSHIQIILTK